VRSFVAAVLSLMLSTGCAKTAPSQPARTTPTSLRLPKEASKKPFHWSIQVIGGRSVTTYLPGTKPETLVMPDSDWECGHTGLKANLTNEGDYVELRDIVCRLKSGHAVGGRTACLREPSGKVSEDTQMLSILSTSGELKILTLCSESEPNTATPPAPTPASKPDPYFEEQHFYKL